MMSAFFVIEAGRICAYAPVIQGSSHAEAVMANRRAVAGIKPLGK
jgi:hypothetical protein